MGLEAHSTDETIQLMYKGGSMMFKAGKATAKNAAAFASYLQAKLKAASENKLSGELDLGRLNKDGQPLTCYELRYEDFHKIKKDAKEYGLVYGVIFDKKNPGNDDPVTLFIRQIDAVKLERILDKHKIGTINPDLSDIKLEYDKDSNVIHAQVDLGEEKTKPQAGADGKEDDNPLTEALSEKNLTDTGRRKSVRTELQKIQEQAAAEKSLNTKSMDEQLEEEFGQNKKSAGQVNGEGEKKQAAENFLKAKNPDIQKEKEISFTKSEGGMKM